MIGMVPTECDSSRIRNRLTPHKHGPTIVHNLILALFNHIESAEYMHSASDFQIFDTANVPRSIVRCLLDETHPG